MMKNLIVAISAIFFLALQANSVLARDLGDRIEERLDRRGDRIDYHLDKKGERINNHLDRQAERALENGYVGKAIALDRKGDRIERRLDIRGDRIDAHLDRKGKRIERRLNRR